MRISDWSSDVCSSDLLEDPAVVLEDIVDTVFLGEALECPDRRHQFFKPFPVGVPLHHAAINSETETPNARARRSILSRPTLRSRRSIPPRSEEHTSELQSLMRISYAVFCLKKKRQTKETRTYR